MPITAPTSETPLSLDNNIFTHLRKKQPYFLELVKSHRSNTGKFPVISSTTIFEATFGIQKSLAINKISEEEANSHSMVISVLSALHTVIAFDQKAAEIAAYIFVRLSQKDKNKHWRDMFIVATAVAHNYGLATQNKRDMELIGSHLPNDRYLPLAIWKP